MKSLGIVRKIDPLGRVVLPKELRDTMDLPEGTPMAFYTDADSIVIREHKTHCEFCPGTDGLIPFGGKFVCQHCRDDLK